MPRRRSMTSDPRQRTLRLSPLPMLVLASVSILATACGGAGSTTSAAQPVSGSVAAPVPSPDNPNLAQCGKSDRTITDAQNVPTVIHGVPQRVVTIELSFTDDVSLLGVKPVGAGDDNDPNLIIPQIKQRIGGYTSVGTRESPNVAVIAGLKPDLI